MTFSFPIVLPRRGLRALNTTLSVNLAPTLTLANVVTSMSENFPTVNRNKIADIIVTDSDGGIGVNTLSLTGSAAEHFEIFDGDLYLKAGMNLGLGGITSYSVTVNVDDTSVGLTPDDSEGTTLTVINSAPNISLSNVVNPIPDNTSTASRVKVADIETQFANIGSHVYSLTGTDASKFEIFSGDLYLIAGTLLNATNDSSFSVTVNVDDTTIGAGGSIESNVSQTFTITNATVPGTTTLDSPASSVFAVPHYDTLTVECFGPGGPGSGISNSTTYVHGTQGNPTTVSTLGLSAGGGAPGNGTPGSQAGGAGGAPSGGNTTNTTGDAGGNGVRTLASGAAAPVTSGVGGSSPGGGTGGASVSSNPGGNGNPGNGPGGAGSGAAWYSGGFNGNNLGAPGGGSGAYVKSVYIRGITVGAPAVGAMLAWEVTAGPVGGNGAVFDGGSGANGRVRFTVA